MIYFESVGSFIDLEKGIVYPAFENDTPDMENGVEIYETSEEWFDSLTVSDLDVLISKGLFEYLK